jgi:hypothetical protein
MSRTADRTWLDDAIAARRRTIANAEKRFSQALSDTDREMLQCLVAVTNDEITQFVELRNTLVQNEKRIAALIVDSLRTGLQG